MKIACIYSGSPKSKEAFKLIDKMYSLDSIEEADVIVCMFDGRAAVTSVDYDVVNLLRQSGKPVYYVANKMDEPAAAQHLKEFKERTDENIYEISAELGEGLEPVKEFLYSHFFESRSVLEEAE